jgi:Rhs element Vgr protein
MSGVTPTVTISSGGTKLKLKDQNIAYIDIRKKANRIPLATLVLMEGGKSKSWFELSDGSSFEPGKEIEIKLRVEGEKGAMGKDQSVFKGIVVRHAVQARSGGFFLKVEMKDKAVKLATLKKSRIFKKDKKDKDFVEEAIKDGAAVKKVSGMDLKHTGEMVQYNATNWDFILSRAEANGCWVMAEEGKITIDSPATLGGKSEKHKFENVDLFFDLELEADIGGQVKKIKSVSWDIKKQTLSSPKSATAVNSKMGNLKADKGAKEMGATEDLLVNATDLSPTEIKAWADAKMRKTRMAMMKGRISLPGSPKVKVGEVLKISKVGKRFNGKGLISGVRHYVDPGGWRTDIQVGGDAEWFYERRDIMDPPAAGLLPGISGLQIGIVDKFEKDDLARNRVRVKIPAVNEKDVVWARIASIDSGKERGFFFRPEKGDEVVLGFFAGDPRQPVILGGMHNDINKPPVVADDIKEENFKKGIFTKEKLKIAFNEEVKEITIATPKENFITLTEDTEEDKAGIIWTDQNKNVIKTDKNKISIENEKGEKITMEPEKNITLQDSKGNKAVLECDNGVTVEDKDGSKITINSDGITLDSASDVTIKGANITLEGSGDIKVEGSGKVTAKGSAVELN